MTINFVQSFSTWHFYYYKMMLCQRTRSAQYSDTSANEYGFG